MIFLGKPIEQIMGVGALLLLALGCALVLQPFLSAILWAAVISFSTWPVYQRCERAVGGNKSLAAAMMTLLVALVLVAPFAVMVPTLTDSVSDLLTAVNQVLEQGPPAPPRWVAGLPVIGENVTAYWASLAHDAPAFIIELKKLIGPATNLAVASGAVLGAGLLELGLSVFIAFFFFLHGRQMAAYVRAVGERFAGPRSKKLLTVVGATVKGVIYGLIGTALAQAVLAGIGFWIAGVPQALLLGFLTFVLAFVPVGPPLVWGSVALWFFVQGAVWWGLFVAAWGLLLVSSIDNVLRPYVLGKTNSLPVLLGLFGFLGGVIAFGFIGVFLGPTLLAVAYSLFLEWHAAEVKGRRHSTSAPPDAA
ncbi:putative membrane protein [Sinorhizobium sojae CCBAU 05684]|uniref:Putative membrane protein n=1 Tax=Sinorhizobium sojae CCBAU 05684 TaxID=716928 RepID=A0A249PCC3_9HYPH|nr:AI-2E family transporter [Sinorhizobium sojae]ASY63558.1 putative membrane protein [Sinorhizobium sojae CCBAU 05684]